MKIHVLVFSHPQKMGGITRKNLELMTNSAEKLGHVLEIIYDHECYMKFGTKPGLLIKNHDLKEIKVLITKANPSGRNMMFRSTVIKQFEMMGIPVINKEFAVMNAKNKLRTLQILTRKGVPVPKSYVVINSQNIDEIVSEIGSFPVILKAVSGSHGKGVSIIESKRGLKSIIEMVIEEGDPEPLIVQQYVREASGKDLRVFIVGRKIVGVMERIATRKGEFRSNFHLGGRVRLAELSEREKEVALEAIKACALDFAGVDIIRTKNGPGILEVNANPGLEGITKATGRDIAGAIIKYAANRAKVVEKRETNGKNHEKA
ncbi:RimK family alpha-L-glutamate ligase [Patescibacteria group bacterium]|nr:RimK family alpha-L-glutamate ligase [Patescibacteria group bacterium]